MLLHIKTINYFSDLVFQAIGQKPVNGMIGNIINFPLAASFCFAFMVVPDGSAKNKITHRESCGCLQVMEIGYY